MLIIFALLLALVGYVVGLKLSILIQFFAYGLGLWALFSSHRFKTAEIGQFFYLCALVVFFTGAVVGNVVYLAAHWQDPNSMSSTLLFLLTWFFTP